MAETVVESTTAVACSTALYDDATGELGPFGAYGLPAAHLDGFAAAYRAGTPSLSFQALRARQPQLIRGLRQMVLDDPRFGAAREVAASLPRRHCSLRPDDLLGSWNGDAQRPLRLNSEPCADEVASCWRLPTKPQSPLKQLDSGWNIRRLRSHGGA